jgi:phosphoglycolate phosphatase/pyrophosphatase PpaX
MQLKGLLFDFDGTLADTLPICFHAFRRVFQEFENLHLTDREIQAMFGPTEVGVLERHIRDKARVPQAVEAYYAYYDNDHPAVVAVDASMHELLDRLKRRGLKLGVFTGKGRRSYEISCRHLGMGGLFDVAVTGDDVTRPKPDPEGLRKALSALGLQPGEVLYVGDNSADIEAGRRAGIRTVGVTWFTATSADPAFRVKPDIVVSEFGELWRIVDPLAPPEQSRTAGRPGP